tara:strand:+ start:1589 stop:1954 length:366 start_codon:yes stop_codon:yes gene_type:complete
MDRFTRPTLRALDVEIDAALAVVAEKHGMTFTRAGGRFSDTTYTPKISFSIVSESGIPADFTRHATVIGLSADDFGREFTTYRGVYRITGINLRARKYPVMAECLSTGKRYKFPVSAVGAA